MNRAKALELLASARNPSAGKPIDRNTRLFQRGKDVAIRLHSTDILTIKPNGSQVLNTGGWLTVTTKDRLNNYLQGARVYSERGIWYVFRDGVKVSEYYDGMRLTKDGKPVNPRLDKGKPKRERALQRRINAYIKGFKKAIEDGLPTPSAGDCWYCSMRTVEGGVPWGDSVRDVSHLESHLEDKYYVPSLLVNAVREQGYGSPDLILHMIFQSKNASLGERALRRYFTKRKRALLERTK